MSQALQKDMLLQSVGSTILNHKGKLMGEITEVMQGKTDEKAEYIIIKSDKFFGRGERFFAIPATSDLIKIGEGGRIILNAERDDLQFAKGIAKDKCPKPNFGLNPSIFELYRCQGPAN